MRIIIIIIIIVLGCYCYDVSFVHARKHPAIQKGQTGQCKWGWFSGLFFSRSLCPSIVDIANESNKTPRSTEKLHTTRYI